MSKERIIITVAAGLISFAGMFALAWLTQSASVSPGGEPGPSKLDTSGTLAKPGLPKPIGTVETIDETTRKAMSENRLKGLIFDVREKMQEYDNKLLTVEQREQRLQIAQDTLKKDIENLNNLRIELASIVASLKEERDKLLATRVGIAQDEKKNLVKIAATYDKMDSASAGKILTNMCTKQVQGTNVVWAPDSLGDVVKILHYMTERTKAKVLAELVTTEPQLAALVCRKLKQITEDK